MAILDGQPYSRCKKCSNAEFIIETRTLLLETIKKNTKVYTAEPYKAIVCSNCGEVHDRIKTHDNKELIML